MEAQYVPLQAVEASCKVKGALEWNGIARSTLVKEVLIRGTIRGAISKQDHMACH